MMDCCHLTKDGKMIVASKHTTNVHPLYAIRVSMWGELVDRVSYWVRWNVSLIKESIDRLTVLLGQGDPQPGMSAFRHLRSSIECATSGFVILVMHVNQMLHGFSIYGHFCGRDRDANMAMRRIRPLLQMDVIGKLRMDAALLHESDTVDRFMAATDFSSINLHTRTLLPLLHDAIDPLAKRHHHRPLDIVKMVKKRGRRIVSPKITLHSVPLLWITPEEGMMISKFPKIPFVGREEEMMWIRVRDKKMLIHKFNVFLLHTHERVGSKTKLNDDVLWIIFQTLNQP